MPVITRSRKESSAERRAAILKAARAVFARQGYAGTVIDDIAAAAHIGKGTVYLYFDSKEQIYLDAVTENARELQRVSRESIAAAQTWRDKLRAYMEVRLQYIDANKDFVRIYVTEFRNMCMQGKAGSTELHNLMREGETQLLQVFAAAAAKGEIRQVDPELAASSVADLTRGMIDRRLLGWRPWDVHGDMEFALDLLYRSLEPAASQ